MLLWIPFTVITFNSPYKQAYGIYLQGRGGPGVGPNLGTAQHPSGAIPGKEMFSGS